MKHLTHLALLLLLTACYQDDVSVTINDTGDPPPPTVIRTTFTMVVVDGRGNPIDDATIDGLDGAVDVTPTGELRINSANLSSEGTLVTVSSPGTWPERRLLVPAGDGQLLETFVLEEKVKAGSIDPTTGGRIDLAENFSVEIPANAVVTTADGAAYTGPVEVFINHDAPEDGAEMLNSPGNALAVMPDGSMANLESYGMMDIALETPAGAPLELSADNPAEVRMPLLATTTPDAPPTVPFWVLDPNGFWQDAGIATLGDNCYVVYVNVSGGYNCDIPRPAARVCGRLVDANGYPLTHTAYAFHIAEGWSCWNARTDCNGEFCALIAAEAALNIYVTDSCSGEALVVPVPALAANEFLELGDITLELPSVAFPIEVSGCTGDPFPAGVEVWVNGYGGQEGRYIGYDAAGRGAVSIPDCNGADVFVQAFTPDYKAATRRIQRNTDEGLLEELVLCPGLSANENFTLTIDDQPIPVSELAAIYWPDNGNFNWLLRAGAVVNGEEYSFLLNFSEPQIGEYATEAARLAIYRLDPGEAYGEGLVYVDPTETLVLTGTSLSNDGVFEATVTATMNLQDDVAQRVDAVNQVVTANFRIEL